MPLVFVHGVASRKSPRYEGVVAARDAYFDQYLLPAIAVGGRKPRIFNPYWGDRGANFNLGYASLHQGKVEQLGADAALAHELLLDASLDLTAMPDSNRAVVLPGIAAEEGLLAAVDLLWTAGGFTIDGNARGAGELAGDLARLADAVQAYTRAGADLSWLGAGQSNREFIVRLQREVSTHARSRPSAAAHSAKETLGFDDAWERIKEGADRFLSLVACFGRNAALRVGGEQLHRRTALFMGDVFVYLQRRGTLEEPGPIIKCVLADLVEASRIEQAQCEPLIVIGHSLGGVICYDILSYFAPTLQVDCLITVGSQLAMFEELKLFPANQSVNRVQRGAKPAGAKRWINVYDPQDFLGYRAGVAFDGVEEYEYDTGAGLLSTHSTYFLRPSFHERLRERIRSDGQRQ